jgi:hypothetical protein
MHDGSGVPFNFTDRHRESGTIPTQATDDNIANLAIGYAQQIIGDYANAQLTNTAERAGRTIKPNAAHG